MSAEQGVGAAEQPARLLGRLARSSGWAVAGYVVTAASGLGVSIMVARQVGPAGFGSYSYFMWLLRFAAVLGTIGIPTALSRFASESLGAADAGGARGIYRTGLHAQLALAPVVLAATATLVWLKAHDALLAAAIGSACSLLTVMLVIEGALVGLRRFRRLAANASYAAVAQLALIALGVWRGVGWRGFLLLQTLVAFLTFAVWLRSGRVAFRAWIPRPTDRETRRRFLRFAAMMAAVALSDSVLWGRPELFFLDRWHSDADVGLYGVALAMASLTSSIPLVASRVFLPEFSSLLGGKREDTLRRSFPHMCTFAGAIAIPMGVGGALLSAELIRTGYGGSFAGAAAAASIVMSGSILAAIAGPASAGAVTGPRPAVLVRIAAGFAVVNLLLDVLLIPPWGVAGAAVASTASQGVSVLAVIWYVRRSLGFRYPWGSLAKLLAAAAAAGLVGKAAGGPFAPAPALAVAVPVAVAVYVAMVRAIGVITWSQVREALRRPAQEAEALAPEPTGAGP